ncbi:MAG: DUF362 domain-containing protein [Chitinivibrionales bacterium]|nr:DUF362 domain-containing protein [Chitinivibrionales bacterium]
MNTTPSKVYFADVCFDRIEGERTLPAKFGRMLKLLLPQQRIKDRSVGIKMHFGGGTGYTTIPPLFMRLLAEALKDAGARSICAFDNDPQTGIARGYTREVLGCEVVSTFGASRKYLYKEKIGYQSYDFAEFSGEAVDCDFFIDFSHVKGHGACGFGGALKNIAMGAVSPATRGKIHSLEGGIAYDKSKCTFCKKCFNECSKRAIQLNEETRSISHFFHNCTYCQHCIMICPSGALTLENRAFSDFARGMAATTAAFLKKHAPEDMLFINLLLSITIICDCWGLSTPALVPDIGVLAGSDLVAVDTASLDLIKTENLLPQGLPKGRTLEKGKHLFEKIHGKDPYLMLKDLAELGGGSSQYELEEIR